MKEEYIKESDIRDKNEEEKNEELIKTIWITKNRLAQAHQNFEFAEDDLIDYYSYNIKANQSKLDYLIKIAKMKGLIMDKRLQKLLSDDEGVG